MSLEAAIYNEARKARKPLGPKLAISIYASKTFVVPQDGYVVARGIGGGGGGGGGITGVLFHSP